MHTLMHAHHIHIMKRCPHLNSPKPKPQSRSQLQTVECRIYVQAQEICTCRVNKAPFTTHAQLQTSVQNTFQKYHWCLSPFTDTAVKVTEVPLQCKVTPTSGNAWVGQGGGVISPLAPPLMPDSWLQVKYTTPCHNPSANGVCSPVLLPLSFNGTYVYLQTIQTRLFQFLYICYSSSFTQHCMRLWVCNCFPAHTWRHLCSLPQISGSCTLSSE